MGKKVVRRKIVSYTLDKRTLEAVSILAAGLSENRSRVVELLINRGIGTLLVDMKSETVK